MATKIKKGDMVQVIAGSGRREGLRGRVLAIYPDERKVIVEGVNFRKKHEKVRQTKAGNTGGITEKEAKIDVSNVMLVDPKTDAASGTVRPTRVGFRLENDGTKKRYAKRSGTALE